MNTNHPGHCPNSLVASVNALRSFRHHHPVKLQIWIRMLLAVMLACFSAVSSASGELTTIAPTMANWNRADNGVWTETAEGLKFNASGSRLGNAITTKDVYDLTGAAVYIKWKPHGNGSYMYAGPALNPLGITAGSFTTNNSWAGSKVITEDAWYYTRFQFIGDTNCIAVTCTGNYTDAGGTLFFTNSQTISDTLRVKSSNLMLWFSDNHGGSAAYMVLGEAKTTARKLTLTPALQHGFETDALAPNMTVRGAWSITTTAFNSAKALQIRVSTGDGFTLKVSNTARISFDINHNCNMGIAYSVDGAGGSSQWGAGGGQWYHVDMAIPPTGTHELKLEIYSGGADGTYINNSKTVILDNLVLYSEEGPSPVTGTATAITTTTATLNGTVNPNGLPSSAQFEYGLTTDYGSTAGVTLSPNNDSSAQAVSASLSGLEAGTTYHYRLVATSGAGTGTGSDATFDTQTLPITTVSELSVNPGTMTPAFDPATTQYSVTVMGSGFDLSALVTDPAATLQVRSNGGDYANYGYLTSYISLNIGSNTVDLKVTTADGLASRTYTLAVTRTLSVRLASLDATQGTLVPAFSPAVTTYAMSVPINFTALTASAEDPTATIELRVNGGEYMPLDLYSPQRALSMGPNVFELRVSAADHTSSVYTLTATRVNGTICDSFNPQAAPYTSRISALAVQADGATVVGGFFTTLGGEARSNLGRVNLNGTLDSGFDPGVAGDEYAEVFALAVQADGKILVGGRFTTLGGASQANLGRLNPDGSLDADFAPTIGYDIETIVVQPDGKILLGGWGGLERLNTDGSPDGSFASQSYGKVHALALCAEDKILVQDDSTGIYRLNSDGTWDTGFQAPDFDPSNQGGITRMAVQADGKILVWCLLSFEEGVGIIRLNSDGSMDTSFSAAMFSQDSWNGVVLMPQPDGKILVGGGFTSLCGQARQNLARLNANGTLDTNFIAAAASNSEIDYPYVSCFALLPDGRIVVGGSFTLLGGQPRLNIGRLVADGLGAALDITTAGHLPGATVGVAYNQTLTATGGTAPYVWAVISGTLPDGLELSADGVIDATPATCAGAYAFTVAVTDSNGWSATKDFVLPAGELWFSDSSPALPLGIRDAAYDFSPKIEGGTAPYTWTLVSGNLPPGLSLSGGGRLTGTPSALGTSTFTMRAVDVDGISGEVETSMTIYTSTDLQDLRCFDMVPDFDPATTQYTLTRIGSLINVAAIQAAPDATLQVRINGGPFEAWNPEWEWIGQEFPLNIGSNTLELKVTASDGVTSKTYTLVITRTLSDKLRDLATSNGALTPVFDPEVSNYSVSLPNDYLKFSAYARDDSATLELRINGGAYEPLLNDFVNRQIALTMGNNVIDVRVTAADNSTATYTLTATRLHGTICDGFDPGLMGGDITTLSEQPGVTTMAVQADGKILVGGIITSLGGQLRNHLGRLHSNGTLDTSFHPGTSMGTSDAVAALAVQADGRILVGGEFTTLAGQSRAHLGRLHPDGTLDLSLAATTDGAVAVLAVQPDGKILVGGSFKSLNGQAIGGLGRLNPDGSLDPTFTTTVLGVRSVRKMAVQADGKIILATTKSALNPEIIRLNADGTLDAGFESFEQTSGSLVSCLALQADGKILLGCTGQNDALAMTGGTLKGLARLNSDGSLDSSFVGGVSTHPWLGYGGVLALQPLADGKILVGGRFSALGEQFRYNLGRLHADGTTDLTFNPGVSGGKHGGLVSCFALQSDSRIIVAGAFTILGGQPRMNIGRLVADELGSPVIITTNNPLPGGSVGTHYAASLTASGGASPHVWTLAGGSLPSGLILGADGTLTGTPASADTSTFTARVTDALSQSAEVQFSLAIALPADFAGWKATRFSPDELADPTVGGDHADPDGDGLSNLLEYALALEPRTANVGSRPTTATVGGHLTFTYRQSKSATDLTFTPQFSTALAVDSWGSNGLVETGREDMGTYWLVTVTDDKLITANARCFMRLYVNTSP